ncbi:MAG: hypothetical protein IPL23_26085 [Saprospiraceae bacterium]|nr:hypothetical protein [Saprospiraceae bacterium]MBP7642499.1 hypothetical protein [Saprospiraceae bacterium]HMS67123.1 hypothetical protein [Saprospiraceae bacterium]
MSAIKDQIRERLDDINDEDFLNGILDLMNNVDSNGHYQLTKSQIEDINISLDQISKGDFVTHEEWRKNFQK